MAKLPEGSVRMTAVVSGYVQGVGFRWSTMSVAQHEGLSGFAENRYDGDVLVVAEGPRESCEKLLSWLQGTRSGGLRRPGRVQTVTPTWGEATGQYRSFSCR